MWKEAAEPFRYPKWSLRKVDQGEPSPSPDKPKIRDWAGTVRKLARMLFQQKGRLTGVLLMVLLSSSLALLGPFLVGWAIDHHLVPGNSSGLVPFLFVLASVYLLHSASVFLQNFWMIRIAQDVVFRMRTRLFKQLHRLPISFFDQRRHGEIMSRSTNDIENISSTLNSSIVQICTSVLTLGGTIVVMLWLSPLLTLLTFIVIPVMFYGLRWITRRTGVLFKEVQKNMGELNGQIEETLSGQSIVKVFSQEDKMIAEFREKNERLRQCGYWAQTYSGIIPKLMNSLNHLNFAIIAGIGGLLAFHQLTTIGVIVIFAEYTRQFTRPLNDLANQWNTVLSAVAGAERVFEILEEPRESSDEADAVDLRELRGEVIFDRVSFSYNKGEEAETVSDIGFRAEPGEMIALVGPTGAGKTTIINLLSRFYDADEGRILIDGLPVVCMKRESLRRHMAFVLQDAFLFEGTVRENIRYGRLEADEDEVVEAAKQANAHSFIMTLSDGYDTVLKPYGSGISQGQKQLLSIARAILANPSLLILDEATSNIDTITEMTIQEGLQRLMKGRTSFVIAHRLNTIRKADRILVLNQGRLIEQGPHEQLLHQDGFYAGLFHSQLKRSAG